MDVKDMFNSVHETLSPKEVTASGKIPPWLKGFYYKVANGKYDLSSDFSLNHAFDGYAIVYQFRIKDGKVRFWSKYLNSDAYVRATSVGKPMFTEYGTRCYPDPNKNFFSRVLSSVVPGDLTDNDAFGVLSYRGNVYAFSETCFMHQIDPSTLQSSAKIDLSKIGINIASSHYLKDHHGAVYNVGTSFMTGLKYHVYRFPPPPVGKENVAATLEPTKDVKIIATVSSSWKTSFAYYHSFGMSENYFVLIEQPLLVSSVKLLASQVQGKAMKDCSYWTPEENTRYTLIDKTTGSVVKTKFISPPFFYLHVVNTYEEAGHVILDIIASNKPGLLDAMVLSKLRNNDLDQSDQPILQRFVFPIVNARESKSGENLVTLASSKATAVKIANEVISLLPEVLIPHPGFELPCVNPQYTGRKYRYAYGSGYYYDGYFRKSLGKIDVETKEILLWKDQQDRFIGEPMFLPTPDPRREDDGVVIATVTGREKQGSMLVFLDAISFKEIARAEFTSEISLGNHGTFVYEDL